MGIACHSLTAHVLRLDLGGYSLSALVRNSSSQIFPSLFQLQHLEYLDLSYIHLSPLAFPSHLPTLTRLTHLSLKACGLTGRIPGEIGNMSALKFLDINSNDLSGIIPGEIGNMSSLEFLDISFNHFSGPIPNEIGNISRLTFLDISVNSDLEMMQSSSWMRNLRGLEHLGMLYLNLTSDVVDDAASLPNLTSLVMSDMAGTSLSPLANLTSLSQLELAGSYFTRQQPFPIWISNLTSLVSLYLYYYNLSTSIPSAVLSLPHLRNLDLSANPNLLVNLTFIVQHTS